MRAVEGLLYEVEDGVATLTLNRPEKHNSLSREMYRNLEYFLLQSELNDEVQLTVIRGAGGKAFSTGGDLSMGPAWSEDDFVDMLSQSVTGFPFHAFERLNKLIVSGVQGHAHAAGMIICLMSDITVASENAVFRVPELLRGYADPFVPVRLYEYVGLARARWLMYTCGKIDAREAERIGLVAKVAPDDQFESVLSDTIAAILRTGPNARGYYKRMLSRALGAVPIDIFLEAMREPEGMEGARAFIERRSPSWARATKKRL
jgi:enoyl-CoA hydratase